jgi:uncharacterized OB-fold protein
MPKKKSKSKVPKGDGRKCPKCGTVMINGVCPKCKYSAKTAYKNRREAKEFTFAGD